MTCFIHNGDDYLFLKRSMSKRLDPGRLNGVGGRLEKGETYLDAAIREIKEETGYDIKPSEMQLSGVVKLEGGYDEDWVMCFVKATVGDKKVPIGNLTEDGELLWLHKDRILNSGFELVDDVNYCMGDIISGECIFFINAQLDKNQKVAKMNISRLPYNKQG